jgi:hypothetical protein
MARAQAFTLVFFFSPAKSWLRKQGYNSLGRLPFRGGEVCLVTTLLVNSFGRSGLKINFVRFVGPAAPQ